MIRHPRPKLPAADFLGTGPKPRDLQAPAARRRRATPSHRHCRRRVWRTDHRPAPGELDAHVTVVDQHSYHLFQPLLYQVATAAFRRRISPPDPRHLADQAIETVLLGMVTGGLGPAARSGRWTTASPMTSWSSPPAPHAYSAMTNGRRCAGPKDDRGRDRDAQGVLSPRTRRGAIDGNAERRLVLYLRLDRGGPTGHGLAGSHRRTRAGAGGRDFRKHRSDHRPHRAGRGRAARSLPGFPPALSPPPTFSGRLGVEVRLGKEVTRCDADGRYLGDERIEARP